MYMTKWPVNIKKLINISFTKYYYTHVPTYFKYIHNQSGIDMTFLRIIFPLENIFAITNFVYFYFICKLSDKKLR